MRIGEQQADNLPVAAQHQCEPLLFFVFVGSEIGVWTEYQRDPAIDLYAGNQSPKSTQYMYFSRFTAFALQIILWSS